ncbi:MAG: TonB-dependent receptor [Candidatus Delongbacteria bacterium]|nr:TonB-dependent receptor [Candidatus Delongbacteria bacterium]MDD4204906.1 TonB-dependent receptor [Candidatus Delongbacteria bacterium]
MKRSIVLMMITLFATVLFSQTTGKIKGVVLDEQGDPLPGANIVVVGTTWGAEADEDGYYYIIGVRAGTYTLKTEFVGYAPKEAREVKVRVGLTTTQNFKMSSEVIELQEIVAEVVMEQKVEKDVTTSVRTVDMGNIETLAVTQVSDVLKGTAGIKTDAEGELHFRGGRAGEVNYVIDGVSVGDPTGAKSNPVEINFANVEAFNIQKGIPDAEYGDALSGSVNIVYKIGDQEKTSGHVKYATDSFLGDTKLNYNRGEFSLSGPIPLPMNGMKPTYYIATDFTLQDGYARSYRVNGDSEGEFFDFKDYDLTGFGFELPQARENNFNIMFKSAYDFSPTMKLSASFTRSRTHNYDFDWAYRYTPETTSEQQEDVTILNLNWRHTLNQQSYYDFIFSYYNREFENLPGGKTPDEFVYSSPGHDSTDVFESYDIISNGVRDGGDAEGYIDNNFNGYFDRENFTDGSNGKPVNSNYDVGENFVDANGNGFWDGDRLFDSNGNNAWDHWEKGTSYTGFGGDCLTGEIVEGYRDTNLNGHYDENLYSAVGDEPFTDGDLFTDTGEPFVDQKRFMVIAGEISEYANNQWDEGETSVLAIKGTDTYGIPYDYSGQLTAEFWERIEFIKTNQFYNSTVTVAADTSTITIKYPKEFFADLRSSLGSLSQPAPRFNDVYNVWYDGVFDEFEAYCSWRYSGSTTDESQLGWTAGHAPTDNPSDYVEFIGSYSVYRAPASMYSNVPNVADLQYDSYSTWMDNNRNGVFDNPNDIYDSGEDFVDYNYDDLWNQNTGFLRPGSYMVDTPTNDGMKYSLFDNTVMRFKGSYTNQINRFHMIKTGFEFTMNDLDYYRITNPYYYYEILDEDLYLYADDPYPYRGEEKTQYKYEPKEFSAYLQDKMEFEDLVVNAGVRLDMRILDQKSVDVYEEKYEAEEFGYEEEIDKYKYAVSPRFGISHSISETSKLFFSYGHLYQLPTYTQIYDPNTKAGRDPLFGNMNLGYMKNVNYELGVVNEVGDYLIDITGYFKDIYDMINTKTYEYGVTNASIWYNSDYGKSRGVEITIDKSLSNHYLWGFSYTLSYAYGKSSSETSNLDDDVYEVKEFPLDWDERHTLNTYLTFVWGRGETLFDVPYTDDWTLSFSTDFGSGKPFTPTTDYFDNTVAAEDIETNSERMPWTSNTDVKLSKTFAFTGENNVSYGRLKLDFDIYNLFNKINVFSVYTDTGSWWRRSDAYYEVTDTRSNLVDIFKNPENIDERRHYRFSVSYLW